MSENIKPLSLAEGKAYLDSLHVVYLTEKKLWTCQK